MRTSYGHFWRFLPAIDTRAPRPDLGRAFVSVTLDGERLSLQGVIGPTRDGNAWGDCGQIVDTLRTLSPNSEDGWTAEMLADLCGLWDRWHLNHMNAGCAHQRALGWGSAKLPDGRWAGHVWPGEHPDGVLTKACPECSYCYGTDWLTERLPVDIDETFDAFPLSNANHPWGTWKP